MAIDNLNYMVSGLPAGQQTDKYSGNPGCVKSKNLDIFSSSKSVKATAWSEPVSVANDYVDIDSKGNLRMMADGKVYDKNGTLVVNPLTNFQSYKVSYKGDGSDLVNATFGTPKRMFVLYEGDEWKSISIFTTTTHYTYNKTPYVFDKVLTASSGFTKEDDVYGDGYRFPRSGTSATGEIELTIPSGVFGKIQLQIYANQYTSSETDITIEYIRYYVPTYYYEDKMDNNIQPYSVIDFKDITGFGSIVNTRQKIELDLLPVYGGRRLLRIRFRYNRHEGITSGYNWSGDALYVKINEQNSNWDWVKGDGNGDCHEVYQYIPLNENRVFMDLGEFQFEKGISTQTLYNWSYQWVTRGQMKTLWSYDMKGVRNTDPSMTIETGVVRNLNPYLIGNGGGNGYIIPAPIGGDTETPYIAEGIKFLNAVPQDYYLYLVGEERGVSGLYVYSGQQLVKLLSGTEIKSEFDTVDNAEQYRFSGIMCNYKSRVVLGTEDGRVFMYGKTTNGNGGSFIHETGGNITGIKVQDDKLVVEYTKNNIKYRSIFEDAIHSKNYNTEFEAIYPITLGNHILEKEESDLYTSYILPSKDCKLEFRATANHYTYWSFKSDDEVELEGMYKMKGWTGDYDLEFIEKNGKRYTFRLWGDLPVQTTNEMKITNSEGAELINYTEYNNFRRIGVIETAEYLESKTRFHNINNLLDLPRTHSIQIMVRGYGTQTHTPELFNVDLVASQRERG